MDLEICKIRLAYGQLACVDLTLCLGDTMECHPLGLLFDLSTSDLLDEHLGLIDDVTPFCSVQPPVTAI